MPDDWQTYKRVRIAALASDPHAFASTLDHAQQLTDEEWKARLVTSAFFIGDLDGQPAGLVGGHRRDGHVELISMWVAPEARRVGLGTRLIEALVKWAAAEGYETVRLWVVEGNAAAEKAYAKSGFSRTQRRQPVREGEPEMEIEMARATRPLPRTS